MTASRNAAIREWWATHETPKQAAARFGLTTREFWRIGHPEQSRSRKPTPKKIRRRWFDMPLTVSDQVRVIETALTARRTA